MNTENTEVLPVDKETDSSVSQGNTATVENQNSSSIGDAVSIADVELAAKIDIYEAALQALQANSPPSHEAILQVLLARDALQIILETKDGKSVNLLLKLQFLDEQLKKLKEAIAQGISLPLWRDTLYPSSNNWWWFFEVAKTPQKIKVWERVDWVFNLLTILCLTGFVSFVSQVLPLVFAGGLSLGESIGLLGPGGMVALVLSSIRGGEGHKRLMQIMNSFGIPSRFQSEVTFLIAAILFAGGYYAQENLPRYYFHRYREDGNTKYNHHFLREAKKSFESALEIPNQDALEVSYVHRSIGLIEEIRGDDAQALKQFQQALELGDPLAYSDIGRLKIFSGQFDEAETFLNLELQKKIPNQSPTAKNYMQYRLYRNLGWTYLNQKRYAKAQEYLNKALEFDKEIPKGNSGKGIANCLLAKTHELLGKPDEAATQWKHCADFGIPESVDVYKEILKMNPEVGAKLNTSYVFNRDQK